MTVEHPEPGPRSGLRASHADRDATVERLRDAAAEGRLDASELDARLEQALTAKTFADLEPLTADLPPVAGTAFAKPLVLKGGINGVARAGRWRVPAQMAVSGGMGGAKLDFTSADCELTEAEIEVHGQMGGVTIVVPGGWAVDTVGMNGGVNDKTTPDRLPGTPVIRLSGTGGFAGVTVRHPNILERRKSRRNEPRGR